ncbi:MAG: response regulator [Prevotella sp.]|nr:response regulator [Prevotella sp.]
MKRLLSILTFLYIFIFCASANYRFRHLSSQDGLPHQQVETMAQDRKGNIWIGTRNGLVCYDGYEMHTYFHDDEDPHSLSNNFVKVIHCDRKGRIWVCTELGISRYRPATDDFATYHDGTEHVLSLVETSQGRIIGGGDNLSVYDEESDSFVQYPALEIGFIVSMTVSPDDQVYVASNTSIYSYDASLTKITRLDSRYYEAFTTGIDGIIPMTFDHQGMLWLGRNGQGVMRIDLKSGVTRIYQPQELSNGIVRTITEDNDHNIWLGTEKGITVIHPDGTTDIVQHRFQSPTMLSDNAIYCIMNDRHGNLWIGSYFGGVDILLKASRQFEWAEPSYADGQLHGKVVRQMAEVATHGQSSPAIWLATEDAGINIYDTRTRRFAPFTAHADALGTNVHALHYDKAGQEMWIGTFRRGLFRYHLPSGTMRSYLFTHGLPSDAIFDFARDSRGRLWIATTQGLRRYDPAADRFEKTADEQLNTTFVYCLCADGDGRLWAGTSNAGLFCIDTNTGSSRHWTRQPSGLKDNYITCLCQDSDGRLWIGTNNSGLQYMEAHHDKPLPFDIDAQLGNATICALCEDDSHHLWITTGRGLYCYDLRQKSLKRYTTQDGLPTNQFNFSSALLSADGLMHFGTVNGLVTLGTADKSIKTRQPLAVHLSQLTINGQAVTARGDDSPLSRHIDDTDTITLSHDQARSFTLHYNVIEPGQNSSVEYQLWVEGIDRGWRNVGSERRFNGFNLRPGTYRLHLRANTSNDGWDSMPQRILTIIVRPPFYLSTWAFLVYGLLLALLVYLAWRIVNGRMKSRNEVQLARMEKAKIEEVDRAKFDFFTTVSHELKTPLSLIVAPLRSIAQQELSDEARGHLSMAIKNTRKMESLIGELVTFNKIETDQFPFYVQQGNPLEFIERGVHAFADAARDAGLQLSVVTEDNGEEVWFSPDYAERILNNLLSNALKFTPQGGSVSVKASIEEADHLTYLCFSVSDTGIGIAKEELQNIFNRYYQTKRGHNVNNSGWGIGLSLVKRLAEVHKGSMAVDSELGHGSSFTCRLCVDQAAFPEKSLLTGEKVIVPVEKYEFKEASLITTPHATADGDTDSALTEGQAETLLIVEDNADMLDYLRTYFSKEYHVLTATNGREALDIIGSQAADMVVSDVMMPLMDGIELCQSLKQSMETSHIPVILLTAKSDTADVVAGYRSGAEAYVAKPFEPEALALQIKNIMQLQKKRQTQVQQATDQSDIDATTLSELDKQFIRQINELVDHNLGNSDFAVGDITRALLVSRSLLHTKMKSLVGLSMGDFIRKKRLDRACQMLRQGYNVSETAYATGFSDPNYFSKTFKKHLGVNPSEYR